MTAQMMTARKFVAKLGNSGGVRMIQKLEPKAILAIAFMALIICGPGFWIGFHFPFMVGLGFAAFYGVVIASIIAYYAQQPTYRAGKAYILVDLKHFKEALIVFGVALGGNVVGFVIHQVVRS